MMLNLALKFPRGGGFAASFLRGNKSETWSLHFAPSSELLEVNEPAFKIIKGVILSAQESVGRGSFQICGIILIIEWEVVGGK